MREIFKSKLYWFMLAWAFSIVLVRVAFVPIDEHRGARTHWRGDAYSEKFSVSAASFWIDNGFLSTYFRPVHERFADPKGEKAYLHYPPFSEVVTTLAMKLVGTDDLRVVRLVPTAISLIFILIVSFLLVRVFPDRNLFLWMLFLYLGSNYFVGFADNLYVHAYAEMLKLPFVVLLYRHYKNNDSWTSMWPLAIGCLLLGQVSPSYTIFCAVTAVGFSIAFKASWRKVFAEENLILGLGFIGGFLIHIQLNALYLGSWEACFEDLRSILGHRGSLPLSERLQLVLTSVQRVERMYLLPGWAFFVFHLFYLRHFRDNPYMKSLSWILLWAGLLWYVVMAQHASVHSYVSREIGFYVVFVGGVGSWAYIQFLRSRWASWDVKWRALNLIFCLYVVGMMITQQVIPVWWRHGWAHFQW